MNINFQQRVCSLLSCCWQKPRRRKKLYTNWKGRGKNRISAYIRIQQQTDVSPKWKSEQSHKFPSTLNTQNILCCVCRSKLVFVSNLGLVLMLAECTLVGGGFQWRKIISILGYDRWNSYFAKQTSNSFSTFREISCW